MLIEWNDSFKLGIPEVDHEHETLIGLINLFAERLEVGCAKAEVASALGNIHALIEGHFALEEKIMREIKFDGYPAHKEDHERLLEEIRDIMDDVTKGDDEKAYARLAPELDAWFSNHFRTLDKSFHALHN